MRRLQPGPGNGFARCGRRDRAFRLPSIWAWRAERIEKNPPRSRPCAVHLPRSSPSCWHATALPPPTLGHPLAGVIPFRADRAAARARLGLAEGEPVLAILPGRLPFCRGAVRRTGFFQAAALIRRALPAIKMIVPAVPVLHERASRRMAHDCGPGRCPDHRGRAVAGARAGRLST